MWLSAWPTWSHEDSFIVSPLFIVRNVGLLCCCRVKCVFFGFYFTLVWISTQPHFSDGTFQSQHSLPFEKEVPAEVPLSGHWKEIFALLSMAPISVGHVWLLQRCTFSMGIPAVLPAKVISGEMEGYFPLMHCSLVLSKLTGFPIYLKAWCIHWNSFQGALHAKKCLNYNCKILIDSYTLRQSWGK